jgi:hypothetical protein
VVVSKRSKKLEGAVLAVARLFNSFIIPLSFLTLHSLHASLFSNTRRSLVYKADVSEVVAKAISNLVEV